MNCKRGESAAKNSKRKMPLNARRRKKTSKKNVSVISTVDTGHEDMIVSIKSFPA